MKKMRKWLLILSIPFVLLFLALLIIPIFFKDDIRKQIIKAIDENVNADVYFADFDVSLLKKFPLLSIHLYDLQVVGKGVFAKDTLISMKEFSLSADFWSIYEGENMDIKGVDLYEPHIFIKILRNGKANYDIFKPTPDSIPKEEKKESQVNLKLEHWRIKQGKLVFQDKAKQLDIRIEKINHQGKGDFEKQIFDLDIQSELQNINLTYADNQYIKNQDWKFDLTSEINLKDNIYSFKDNFFQINHFKFGFDGFIKLLPHGIETNMEFDAKETEFKNVLSLIPLFYSPQFHDLKTEGEMAFDGYVKGFYEYQKPSLPSFQFHLKVEKGMLQYPELPTAINNIEFNFTALHQQGELDNTSFDLKKFHVDFGDNPFRANALVKGLINPSVDMDWNTRLDLAELEQMFPIDSLVIKGILEADGQIHGQFENFYEDLKQHQYNFEKVKFPTFNTKIALKNGYLKYGKLPQAIENAQFHLTASNTTGVMNDMLIDFKDIDIDFGKNPINGFFKMEGLNAPKLNAEIKADIDLEDIEKIYPLDSIWIEGIVDTDIKIDGIYDKAKQAFPVVDARIKLDNASLKTASYPLPIDKIHLLTEIINKDGSMENTIINLDTLTYSIDDEPFMLRGTIQNLNDYTYDLKAKGLIELEKITKIYPIPDFNIKGEIDTDIETVGKMSDIATKRYNLVQNTGTVAFKNFEITSPSLPQTLAIKDAFLTFNPEKVVLERFIGTLGRSDFSLKGHLYDYIPYLLSPTAPIKADLTMECKLIDLNEMMAHQEGANPKKMDTTHYVMSVIEIPRNVDFVFDSDIDVLKYGNLTIKQVKGEITLRDAKMSMKEVGFNALNSLMAIEGHYNTQNPERPTFDLAFEVDNLDINEVYRSFLSVQMMAPAAKNFQGVFSGNYQLKGEFTREMMPVMETLSGGGVIKIANAKIEGMKAFKHISHLSKKQELENPQVKDIEMFSEIKEGQVIVKPFSFKVADFGTDIEGINYFNGTLKYLIKIAIPPLNIKIPFHITGNYNHPEVAMGKGGMNSEETK